MTNKIKLHNFIDSKKVRTSFQFLPGLESRLCIPRASRCLWACSTSRSVTDLCGSGPRSGWWNLHLFPYVHFFPYGQGGGGSPLRGWMRKKLSNVGPDLPNGSSGGINLHCENIICKQPKCKQINTYTNVWSYQLDFPILWHGPTYVNNTSISQN